jgi:imidazolonepropionase-like amidohydrolase
VTAARLALTAERLLAGNGRVLHDAAVVLEHGRVLAVGTRSELAPLLEGASIDAHGDATILPGLIDAHVHIALTGDGRSYAEMMDERDEYLACIAVEHADQHLRAGVTTIRDLGARGHTATAVRQFLDRRAGPSPRLLVSGRPLTISGGHLHWCNGTADGVDEVRRTVRVLASEGVDCIKLVGSGGGTPNTKSFLPSYTVDELRAGVEAAHDLGLLTAAHCHATTSIENAVAAGVDCIEHVSFLADRTSSPVRQEGSSWSGLVAEYDDRVVAQIAASDCYLGMTLLGGYSAVRAARAQGAADSEEGRRRAATAEEHVARKLGIFSRLVGDGLVERLVISTDAGAGDTRFGELHLALAAAVEGGSSPMQAIEGATRIAARVCGLADETGTLEPGKAGDVLVVAGDAARDIAALGQVRAVYRAGRAVPEVGA